jgi:hypothetical protein
MYPYPAYGEHASEGGWTTGTKILGATATDNLLASKQVAWKIFLGVGVTAGLLGVTVESISSGEIGTRHWTG